jgi:hypothetical protein
VSTTYGAWSIERAITDIYGADRHGNLPVDRYYGGYVSGTVEYPPGDVPPYTPVYGLYKGIQPEMNIYLRGNAQAGVAPNSGAYEGASGVLVRFSYYTDEAVNGQGWFIDDVAVNGFSDDFEAGAGKLAKFCQPVLFSRSMINGRSQLMLYHRIGERPG